MIILILVANFFVLHVTLVSGVTDAPRPNLFPTTTKEILDFDVPLSLIGAEKLALQSSNNQKLASQEISRSVAYSVPFDRNHFDFSNDDWTVYDLPNSDEQMIVSLPNADIAKELTIATTIKEKSNVIIRYQAHLTSLDTPVKPTLSIFLISNGLKTLLKEETPSDLWSNSSIRVNTDSQSQLQFVGILRSQGNQIALRSFSFEILSVAATTRYAVPVHEPQDLPIPQAGENPNFRGAPGPNYNIFTSSDIQGASSQNIFPPSRQINKEAGIDAQYKTNIYDESIVNEDLSVYNNSSIEASNTLVNFSTSNIPTGNYNYTDYQGDISHQTNNPHDIDSQINSATTANELLPTVVTHSDIIPPYTKTTTPIPDQNPPNSSLSSSPSESTTYSSSANGIFSFFAIVIACALLLIAFLWWRQRRNPSDDEIPVFSRSATEHGNPTFHDDEAQLGPGLGSDAQANYRSFQ